MFEGMFDRSIHKAAAGNPDLLAQMSKKSGEEDGTEKDSGTMTSGDVPQLYPTQGLPEWKKRKKKRRRTPRGLEGSDGIEEEEEP